MCGVDRDMIGWTAQVCKEVGGGLSRQGCMSLEGGKTWQSITQKTYGNTKLHKCLWWGLEEGLSRQVCEKGKPFGVWTKQAKLHKCAGLSVMICQAMPHECAVFGLGSPCHIHFERGELRSRGYTS